MAKLEMFENLDPSQISKAKAEEVLLYLRYLLQREHDKGKIEIYTRYRNILEARVEDLNKPANISANLNRDIILTAPEQAGSTEPAYKRQCLNK